METTCTRCGGELHYLGSLGTKHWFRCRSCGLDQSPEIEDVDAEPEDAIDDESGGAEPKLSEMELGRGWVREDFLHDPALARANDFFVVGDKLTGPDGVEFTVTRIATSGLRLHEGQRERFAILFGTGALN